jgi:hypothetical protein
MDKQQKFADQVAGYNNDESLFSCIVACSHGVPTQRFLITWVSSLHLSAASQTVK